MENFGIVFNPQFAQEKHILKVLENLNKQKNIGFYKQKNQNNMLPEFIKDYDDKISLDCILTFGGDGTFLRAVDFSLKTDAPLLGVNLGNLGFLADCSLEELESSIGVLQKKKFKIQHRMMLKIELRRKRKIILSAIALNDAVINRGITPSLIDLNLSCNRRFVVETRCDGIVASTPTGSTAYSLSAGGPIISPVVEAIVITPLNPHVLTVRPIVFSSQDILEIEVIKSKSNSLLQLDGRNTYELLEGDKVKITSAPDKVKFIKLGNKAFFQILRKKFHMGKK